MNLGRDFAAVTTFKAVCEGLNEASCDHVEHLDLSDVNCYCRVLPEANAIGKKLFAEFWSCGGNDMAVLSAAMSRGKVMTWI